MSARPRPTQSELLEDSLPLNEAPAIRLADLKMTSSRAGDLHSATWTHSAVSAD